MSDSLTMSQATSQTTAATATSQANELAPENLTNVDLIRCCQVGARPERTAFAELLRRYWTVPERQIETSVVLGDARWFEG